MSIAADITDVSQFDPNNPDPWRALFLDTNSYMDESAKAALLRGNASKCRRFFFPVAFPIARLLIGVVKLLRILFPKYPASSRLLHLTIYYGLKIFVSPDANYLILRHFNIGTENLRFIADNIPGLELLKTTKPLRPRCLEDLIDDTFLIHDLNIFNFVIEMNQQLREKDLEVRKPDTINFDAISSDPFEIPPLPNKWHNFVDLHTAIELYTPLYALFLSDADFWRASNSLQLDQTVALYVAKILDKPEVAMLVNNN